MSKIRDTIFKKHYSGWMAWIPFSDFPKDLLPTDLINIERQDAYYGSDSSNDAYTRLEIYRERDKTEEERDRDRKLMAERLQESKKLRFEQYKKLKKEFENE